MDNNCSSPTRTVFCEDAISWLEQRSALPGCSLVASLPDISEFPGYTVAQWQEWFVKAASLILSRTPPEGIAVFYQSDIKINGTWVDKGYLCQKAAESCRTDLLWHKIACRLAPGQISFNRSGYSHILCFSQGVRPDPNHPTTDVLPLIGKQTWARGMGLEACQMIAAFIAGHTATKTVVNPFCGQGSMLAAANACDLAAIGIELSRKRAAKARRLLLHQPAGGAGTWLLQPE